VSSFSQPRDSPASVLPGDMQRKMQSGMSIRWMFGKKAFTGMVLWVIFGRGSMPERPVGTLSFLLIRDFEKGI